MPCGDGVAPEPPCRQPGAAPRAQLSPVCPPRARPWPGFRTCSGTSLPGLSLTTESGSVRPGGRKRQIHPGCFSDALTPTPEGWDRSQPTSPAHSSLFNYLKLTKKNNTPTNKNDRRWPSDHCARDMTLLPLQLQSREVPPEAPQPLNDSRDLRGHLEASPAQPSPAPRVSPSPQSPACLPQALRQF